MRAKSQWRVHEYFLPLFVLREPPWDLFLVHCIRSQCDMPVCGLFTCRLCIADYHSHWADPCFLPSRFSQNPVSPKVRSLPWPVNMASLCGLFVYIARHPPPQFPSLLSFSSPARIQQAKSVSGFSFSSPFFLHLLSFRGLVSLNKKKPKSNQHFHSHRSQVTG